MMIPSKDSKMHLERAQAINGVTTVYRCQLAFSGKMYHFLAVLRLLMEMQLMQWKNIF